MIQDTSSQDVKIHKTNHRGRAGLIWILVAVCVLLVLGWWLLPTMRGQRSFDAKRLSFAQVTRGDLVRDLAVDGRIVASSYPTLYAPARGLVTLLARPGQQVAAGEVLARVESPALNNRLQQESSALAVAEAELQRQRLATKNQQFANERDVDLRELELAAAKRAFERAKRVFSEGLINAEDYETAQDDVQIAELSFRNAVEREKLDGEMLAFEIQTRELALKRQRLVVADLDRQVAELALRSPVDGVVGTLNVDPSDVVAQNQAVLTVVDLSAFEVQVAIPEAYADEVRPGLPVEIGFENLTVAGEVSAVAPEVNGSMVTGTVRFVGDLPAGLKQNQRVSTRLVLTKIKDVLKVRRGPFFESGGGHRVYVVRNGEAILQTYEAGVASLSEVEIREGLAQGDRIIVSDTSLFEGAERIWIRQ